MPPPIDSPSGAQTGERIAKLLARAGVASRREIERMIADGRVALGGIVIDTPATVLPSLDGVTVDGATVAKPEPARLFLYHKPTGLLVTEHDPRGRPTIYDRLPKDLPRLVPVGRLDLNTEGLLLLTTDGELKRQLELPASGVERSYRARAYGPVTQAQLEELIEGVEIEGVRYGAIDANLERRTGANSWIELTLTEGKNREVRRVLEHLGLQVGRLIRTRYGPFILADLPPGEIGEVRTSDLHAFRQSLSTKAKNDARIAIPNPPRHGEGNRAATPHGGGGSPQRAATRQSSTARPRPGTMPNVSTTNLQGGAAARAVPRPAPVARPNLHPGAGRGSGATSARKASTDRPHLARPTDPQTKRPAPNSPAPTGKPFKWRGAAPTTSAPKLDPGLRRGRAAPSAAPGQRARTASRPSDRPVAQTTPATTASDGQPPRPAKPQRKTGWAKPKPKSAPPRRPGKPK